MTKSLKVKLFKKFKLLKVLEFEDAPTDCLPQEVGNLFHLKYLSLRRTKVKMLLKQWVCYKTYNSKCHGNTSA
jgi:disease resistance protein RPM1